MPTIAFNRAIGPVPLDVVLTEKHNSDIEITKNPVETGAEVNDHAHIKPNRVDLDIADNDMVNTWQALKALQRSRLPFTVVTGLDIYTNMLIESLGADRDKEFSSTLKSTITIREVIIVDTTYVASDDGDNNSKAGQAGGKKSTRAAKPAGKTTDAVTADRAAGQVQRGDNPTTPSTNTSFLQQIVSPPTSVAPPIGGRPAP